MNHARKMTIFFAVCGIFPIFELRSKLLTFENIQINLVFCSLIRNFAPVITSHLKQKEL
jgi:hypothetical protein